MTALSLLATLIIALPYSDGIGVCADRRAVLPAVGIADNAQKIFGAGDKAVIAISGESMFIKDNRFIFHAGREFALFAATEGTPTTKQDFDRFMPKFVDLFVHSGAIPLVVPTNHENEPLFEINMFYFVDGKPIQAYIPVYFRKGDSSPRWNVVAHIFSGEKATLFVGTAEVPIEMVSGHDPKFDDLRKAYRTFARNKKRSADDVLSFERWLIRESSERSHPAPDTSEADVGPIADCAQLSKDGAKFFIHAEPKQ